MTEKQRNIIIAFGTVVLVGVILGIVFRGDQSGIVPGLQQGGETVPISKPVGYSPVIPAGATASVPKSEAPASANPALDTKLKFFDLKASIDGFFPPVITANSGDNLQISFMAVDGDYDLDIPYLGAYFSVTKRGEIRRFPIDTGTPGTFTFQCRNFCPRSGVIKGSLIVLPKK